MDFFRPGRLHFPYEEYKETRQQIHVFHIHLITCQLQGQHDSDTNSDNNNNNSTTENKCCCAVVVSNNDGSGDNGGCASYDAEVFAVSDRRLQLQSLPGTVDYPTFTKPNLVWFNCKHVTLPIEFTVE